MAATCAIDSVPPLVLLFGPAAVLPDEKGPLNDVVDVSLVAVGMPPVGLVSGELGTTMEGTPLAMTILVTSGVEAGLPMVGGRGVAMV
jgi:hypothetical protein